MKRRLTALLLSSLLLTPILSVSAINADLSPIITTMAALDIMVGDEKGNLSLDSHVNRAQFVKMAVAASPYGTSIGGQTAVSPYPDVPHTHWAAPYVEKAVSTGLITGYLDGTFRPSNQITLLEGVTIVLRLLGYPNSDFNGVTGRMAKYRALGLDKGVASTDSSTPLTRRDSMYLFYNMLTTPAKDGSIYLTTLGHTLTLSGEIDVNDLIHSAMEGPIVARQDLAPQLDFTPRTVYRSGFLSSLSAIEENDVIYYSKSMSTVWAYTRKITGIYQNASPSPSSPTSVTVAGKTYAIETASASHALSSFGTYRIGDQITLLLGKDGGVAAVLSPLDSAGVLYGVVSATGTGSFSNADGESYTSKTVTLTATDGLSYTYPTQDYLPTLGSLMQVKITDDGSVRLTNVSSASISGRVDDQAQTIGNYELAGEVQILDVRSPTETLRVYPARLAGVHLTDNMVRFYATDSAGRISHLILNDVTGDLDQYGILTAIQDLSSPLSVSARYTYNIGGQSQAHLLNLLYYVQPGPFALRTDGSLASLTGKVPFTSLSAGIGYDKSGAAWRLSDEVQVFIYDGDWFFASLGYVTGDYSLTGYYDKPIAQGGCIRVIVAKPT